MGGVPKVLILGHSFVRRIKHDLSNGFDPRASLNFRLKGSANIIFHGVGGRTVRKLLDYDLTVVRNIRPTIVILEIGTNDLTSLPAQTVGSAIEVLCKELIAITSIKAVVLCHVIPRGRASRAYELFHNKVKVLRQYLDAVLEDLPQVFCWRHKVFSSPIKNLYTRDGVHLNRQGQYQLYRSYRGAMLQALQFI